MSNPDGGAERLLVEEKDGRYRVVKEEYEWPHGWLYQDCVVVADIDAILDLGAGIEEFRQSVETEAGSED